MQYHKICEACIYEDIYAEKKMVETFIKLQHSLSIGKILCDMFVPLLYTILMLPHQFLQTQQENSVIQILL